MISKAAAVYSLAKYVEFQTFRVDGQIKETLWCGKNNEVVLVLTEDGGIYRSADRGSQWTKLQGVMRKGESVATQTVSILIKVDW